MDRTMTKGARRPGRHARPLATRARDAFRLTAMSVAILVKPLAELGLLADAFAGLTGTLGTIPAILALTAFLLYTLYGMALCIGVAIVIATGLVNMLGYRAAMRRHA